MLYQFELLACASDNGLLRFFVRRVPPAETAVFLHLQLGRSALLVLGAHVVALLAFAAGKRDLVSHDTPRGDRLLAPTR